MRSQLLIVALLSLSLGTAGAWDGGADIFGTWVFSVDDGKYGRNLTFVFKQNVGAIVGANALVMRLGPIGSDKKTPQLAARYDDVVRRVKELPGVQEASLVGHSPMGLREWVVTGKSPEAIDWPISVQGYTRQPGEYLMRIPSMQVHPNFFAALGIHLLAGRDFSSQDNQKSTSVGIINESMARRFFANENPIGRRFGFDAGCPPKTICRYEVIGVVKDFVDFSPGNEGREMFYLPFSQSSISGGGQMTLVVRTVVDPMALAAAVRREAQLLDPQMPMSEAEPLAPQGEVFTGILASGSRQEKIFGTVVGNKVVFGVEGVSGGWEPFKHTYTGTIESPTKMSGTIETHRGTYSWTATKK
jgi:MacB-like periplasmic core domain